MQSANRSTDHYCGEKLECEPYSCGVAVPKEGTTMGFTKVSVAAVASVGAEVPQTRDPQMQSEVNPVSVDPPQGLLERTGVWNSIVSRFALSLPSLLSFLISLLSVSSWSVAGNACRISLSAAFNHRSFFHPGFSYFGPNAFGSMAIGFFQSPLWVSEVELPWLMRGLCVGFCGSFTTLSSWMIDIANASSFSGAAEELICGLTIPFVFYTLGLDLGKELYHCVLYLRQKNKTKRCERSDREVHFPMPLESVPQTKRIPSPSCDTLTYWWIDFVTFVVVMVVAITIPAVLYGVQHYHRSPGSLLGSMTTSDLRDSVLGPVGAIPRFILCYALNKQPHWRSFPVGTFCSNVLAVLIAMLLYRAEYQTTSTQKDGISGGAATTLHEENVCVTWACAAILTGVCGSLSTVSSFVSEVITFHRDGRVLMAYAYVLATVGVALIIAGVGRQGNFR